MADTDPFPYFESRKNVLLDSDPSVLDPQVAHVPIGCSRITRKTIEDLAIETYRSCGKGITIKEVQEKFSFKKTRAQRSLKHFHIRQVIFTAGDLNSQGIFLIENTNPQQYFPACLKADIVENLKKRTNNVLVQPTGSNLIGSTLTGSNLSNHGNALSNALSNALGYQKAQSFLDVLITLPFTPLLIHKLQLMVSIDKEYYQILANKAERINRAKLYEENIGRRHVIYTFSPNGRVQIAIRSSDTPFRIDTDEDEANLFSFFGQVRDRLIYLVADNLEREVPQMTDWILKGCDLNRDVEIDETAQLSLPDIQLKHLGQVFRVYVKSLHDRSVYRAEKSLTLDLPLSKALDSITSPVKAMMELKNEVIRLSQKIDLMSSK
jgi:hypothetical protein